ncbi:SLBB domain-containing protein, partial [Moorena sp. SIO2C4]
SGQRNTYYINLQQLINRSDIRQDVTLRDGDEILLRTTTAINPEETRLLSNASFAANASRPIQVAVVGEVINPGAYVVKGETLGNNNINIGSADIRSTNAPPTVTQAIAIAGGITQDANVRQVKVRRLTQGGTQQEIALDFWQLLRQGDLSQDILLKEGDTILVTKADEIAPEVALALADSNLSAAAIPVNVVGQVQRPGNVEVKPNSPLNEALLAAGGFDDVRAEKGSVELVRLNRNGTVEKREIEIDFTAPVNEETNPTLQPNDVIIVKRDGVAKTADNVERISRPASGIFNLIELPIRLFNLLF